METEKEVPTWYWCEPSSGYTIEECELIVCQEKEEKKE